MRESIVSAASSATALRRKWRLGYEHRIVLTALASALPGVLVSLTLLFKSDYPRGAVWALSALIVAVWLGLLFVLRGRVVRPLQTLSNLVAALREGDYSMRAHAGQQADALEEVMREINALAETLYEQRLGAMEATALLRTVMSEIDVAVFAFDADERLRLVNRAGERLLSQSAPRLLGRRAGELGLSECLRGEESGAPRTMQITFSGGAGRWGIRRRRFRERGMPHRLLVLTDLSRTLREEELKAWQSLVRVLGHELNNSLTPIMSIAGSLSSLVARESVPADWREDMASGLAVISSRAEALSRFMKSYARLARLPPPRRSPLEVSALVRHVIKLETRMKVSVAGGDVVTIHADADQLEQLLINLLRNAVDAALETGGGVRVGWGKRAAHLEVWIEDEGLGFANVGNLFVPFFTTKQGGSGIGLVLSRQIAEAHGGSLTLENRPNRQGCLARLHLPLSDES
ncbi:MAG TPA: ATP-binding protein [Pyrinomonadaceae bacterium]|jgi:nitrogen fixation/metabolism regulation signal transduction histidine kinase